MAADLRFRAIALPSLAGQISSSLVSVLLAALGFQIWSLVYGVIASQVIATVAYSIVQPWTFRFSVRREMARPLLGYAKHLVSASFLAFLITNIDNFTVGFFLGSTALGIYAVAYAIGYTPVALLSAPAGSALFPSLAKIQLREEVLRQGYLESFGYATVFITPAAFGMAILAPEIVRVLLGPVWIGATVPLEILAFYGLARAVLDFGSSLFAAVGKPRIIAMLNLYVLVGSVILVFPLTLMDGISGTALAMTVPVGFIAVVSISRAAKILRVDVRTFFAKLRSPLLAAAAMGVSVWLMRLTVYAILPDRVTLPLVGRSVSEATLALGSGIPFGLVVYFVLLWVLDPTAFRGIRRHALMVLRPRTV